MAVANARTTLAFNDGMQWGKHAMNHQGQLAHVKKPNLIGAIVIGACVSAISLAWLYAIVSDEIFGGRREYQTILPFVLGLITALFVGIWPVGRRFKGWKKLVVRSMIFTLFLAPMPYGPEGTLMPLIVTLIYPPLVFLFLFPGRIVLSFLSLLGFFWIVDSIRGLLNHSAVEGMPD
jgi:hypothetical protein